MELFAQIYYHVIPTSWLPISVWVPSVTNTAWSDLSAILICSSNCFILSSRLVSTFFRASFSSGANGFTWSGQNWSPLPRWSWTYMWLIANRCGGTTQIVMSVCMCLRVCSSLVCSLGMVWKLVSSSDTCVPVAEFTASCILFSSCCPVTSCLQDTKIDLVIP